MIKKTDQQDLSGRDEIRHPFAAMRKKTINLIIKCLDIII